MGVFCNFIKTAGRRLSAKGVSFYKTILADSARRTCDTEGHKFCSLEPACRLLKGAQNLNRNGGFSSSRLNVKRRRHNGLVVNTHVLMCKPVAVSTSRFLA